MRTWGLLVLVGEGELERSGRMRRLGMIPNVSERSLCCDIYGMCGEGKGR